MNIQEVLYECQRGNFYTAYENQKMINDRALEILNSDDMIVKQNMLQDLVDIIKIGNYTYNNTDADVLPIDDGIYDLLVVKLMNINPDLFTPGALPVIDGEDTSLYKIDSQATELIKPISVSPQEFRDWIDNEALYPNILQYDAPYNSKKLYKPIITNKSFEFDTLTKRVRDTSHNYPELVGTLKKCKFVTDAQAKEKGVFENANVSVLERDFFAPLLQSGVIDQYRPIPMVATLKYDGVSIEADVNTEVISARTRGDTDLNKASDLTEILGGYKFPHAVELTEPIGMKFEAIITNDDLHRMNEIFGTKYINGRTAIIGIFGSSDGRKYRDFITLVPLQCSIKGVKMDRVEELMFLNKYYSTNEYIRWQEFNTPFNQLLFEIKRFTEEAERIRPYMTFMYDGIVVEFRDQQLRDLLGRKNSINQYAMAVKFNTLKRITTFTGFTYTIGQNGQVTPMIHYNPIEFMGAIHTKSTGSSLARVRKLDLYIGDQIEVEYVNDVMPYVHKVNSKFNEMNHRRPPRPDEMFPKYCPCCGEELYVSDAAFCLNMNCPERVRQRLTNMMAKLGINDFAESAVNTLKFKSFSDLMQMTPDMMEDLGPTNCIKLYNSLQNLKINKLEDYRIVGALGFSNIAAKTWKSIFKVLSFQELLSIPANELYSRIVNIKGCGEATANAIVAERQYFYSDLKYIFDNQMYIPTTGIEDNKEFKIRFSGFRDSQLVQVLNMDPRVDANDNEGLTKETTLLLVPSPDFKSSKVDKAKKYGIKIATVVDFMENTNNYIPNFNTKFS